MELNNNGYKNNPAAESWRLDGACFTGSVPVTLYEGRAVCEIAEDFTLPEYLPEIRKLLRVSGVAAVPEKYVSARSIGVSGQIEYCALYVGSDGRVHAASFTDSYEMTAPFSEDAEWDSNGEIRSTVSVGVDGIVSRVTGARRINVRSHVVSDIKVLGETLTGCSEVSREGHMQLLIKSCDYTGELFGESLESEAVDELELTGGDRYVCSYCQVFVDGTAAFSGYVECRGAVIMRHLIERENGKLYDISRRIPFSEAVEVDGIAASIPVTAHGRCVGVKKSVKESGYEEATDTVTVSAQIELIVRGYEGRTLKYVGDAYSTAHRCENQTRSCEMPRLLACSNKNMTLSETRGLDVLGADVSGAEVCDVTVVANAEGVALSGTGKYTVNGSCRFSVVFLRSVGGVGDDADEREYASREVEIPFKYECAEGGLLPDSSSIHIEAVEPRVRCDGENIDLGCELLISYGLIGVETVKLVESTVLGEDISKKKSQYTVCYPSPSDTLWSVSKRYGAPVVRTAKSNGMDATGEADTVGLTDGVRYMIV